LVLAETLGGQDGLALATLCQLPCVLFFNIAAVICFSVYADNGKRVNAGKVAKEIATNPLVVGIALGVLTLAVRGLIPVNAAGEKVFLLRRDLPWVYDTAAYLSRMATPLALVVLGGQMVFADVKAFKKELIAGVTMRLVITPLVGLGLSFLASGLGLFPIDAGTLAVLIAIFGSPLAVATSVMAAEMHADDRFAGQVVVWTTVLSLFTLFLIIALFRAVGLL
ncbi:MAG: AEC family transporter, partial [bacterium]